MTLTESFTDHGDLAAKQVHLSLHAPAGWQVTPTSPTSFPAVETEQTVQATFQVVAPAPQTLFRTDTLNGAAELHLGRQDDGEPVRAAGHHDEPAGAGAVPDVLVGD